MFSSYDQVLVCRRHPKQPVGGICAICLRERLTRLVCPRCGDLGSSRVDSVSCSCSFTNPVVNPLEGVIDVGSVGIISSLIEIDIGNQQRSVPKKVGCKDLAGSGSKSEGIFTFRKSNTLLLAKNSSVDYHSGERRPLERLRKKTLSSLFNSNSDRADSKGAVPERRALKLAADDQLDSGKELQSAAQLVGSPKSSLSTNRNREVMYQNGNAGSAKLKECDSADCTSRSCVAGDKKLIEDGEKEEVEKGVAPVCQVSTIDKEIIKSPSPKDQLTDIVRELRKSPSSLCAQLPPSGYDGSSSANAKSAADARNEDWKAGSLWWERLFLERATTRRRSSRVLNLLRSWGGRRSGSSSSASWKGSSDACTRGGETRSYGWEAEAETRRRSCSDAADARRSISWLIAMEKEMETTGEREALSRSRSHGSSRSWSSRRSSFTPVWPLTKHHQPPPPPPKHTRAPPSSSHDLMVLPRLVVDMARG